MIGDNEKTKDKCMGKARSWARSLLSVANGILADNTKLSGEFSDQNLTDAFPTDKGQYIIDRNAMVTIATYIKNNVSAPKGN